jgi:hypothetical protein
MVLEALDINAIYGARRILPAHRRFQQRRHSPNRVLILATVYQKEQIVFVPSGVTGVTPRLGDRAGVDRTPEYPLPLSNIHSGWTRPTPEARLNTYSTCDVPDRSQCPHHVPTLAPNRRIICVKVVRGPGRSAASEAERVLWSWRRGSGCKHIIAKKG